MIYILIASTLSIPIFLYFYTLYQKKVLESLLKNPRSTESNEQLTSYELERLEREEQFDKRINRLKDELANQRDFIHTNTIAQELHPLVKNLPHNVIRDKEEILPDVEYME